MSAAVITPRSRELAQTRPADVPFRAFAQHDPAVRPGLSNHAGRFDRRRDVGRAGNRRGLAHDRRDILALSTPFCSVSTVVDGPTSARRSGIAAGLS